MRAAKGMSAYVLGGGLIERKEQGRERKEETSTMKQREEDGTFNYLE